MRQVLFLLPLCGLFEALRLLPTATLWVAPALVALSLKSLGSRRQRTWLGAGLCTLAIIAPESLLLCALASLGALLVCSDTLRALFIRGQGDVATRGVPFEPLRMDGARVVEPGARTSEARTLLGGGRLIAMSAIAFVPCAVCVSPALHRHTPIALGGAIGVLMALVALFAFREARDRQLELAPSVRLRATGSIFACCLAASALCATLVSPTVMALGVAFAGPLCAVLSRFQDQRLPSLVRRAVAALMLASPVFLSLAVIKHKLSPESLPVAFLCMMPLLIVAGMLTPSLAERFLPLRGAWLRALRSALEETMRVDVDETVRAVLSQLRAPFEPTLRSPSIWMVEPPRMMGIDAAGYLHWRDRALPAGLLDAAAKEPFGTLRAEVLYDLEVRRAEYRPLATWFRDQGVQAVTVIACKGQNEGILLTPEFDRGPLSLEEIGATAQLASRLASAVAAHGTRARALLREHELLRRTELASDVAEDAAQRARKAFAKNRATTGLLARTAEAFSYAALVQSSRLALGRRIAIGAPIAIAVPGGVDAVAHVARAVLAEAKADSAFVPVDCTLSAMQILAHWRDRATSPLATAESGILLLLDVIALPTEIQELIARTQAERRAPWDSAEAFEFQLLCSLREPYPETAEKLGFALRSRLESALADPIRLPRLVDRSEDLHSMILDRLARESMRVRGTPMGIHPAAFAMFVEYPFEGEEYELDALIVRLVRHAKSDVVTPDDVRALGLTQLQRVAPAQVLRLVSK
jgi:hypothetical protein